eukprot:jgi/Psemu1/192106/e_gw1.123.86.1
MKSGILLCLLSVFFGALLQLPQQTSAFAPVPTVGRSAAVSSVSTTTTTELYFFGKPKDDGSPGDYVCKDCGYVFTKGPQAWAALDDSKYKCPPCGAPKFRFKKVPKGSESGKVEVKKSWF